MSRKLTERLAPVLAEHAGSTPLGLATYMGIPEKSIRDALAALEQQGRAANDDGRWTAVRSRKSRQARQMPVAPLPSTPTGSPAIEAEFCSQVDRFYGRPAGLSACLRAVAGDPVLTARLEEASAAGWLPIDLVAVPKHRQAQTIEDALDEWTSARAGGPCSMCGTATRRRGWEPGGYLDPREMPGWSITGNGVVRCQWCAEYLAHHSQDELLDTVFRLLTGTRGETWHTAFAYADSPRRGDGTPWSHMDAAALRKVVTKDHRYVLFTRPDRPWEQTSLPGLPAHFVWETPPARTVAKHMPESQQAMVKRADETAAWRRQKERREADEAAMRKDYLRTLFIRDNAIPPVVSKRTREQQALVDNWERTYDPSKATFPLPLAGAR